MCSTFVVQEMKETSCAGVNTHPKDFSSIQRFLVEGVMLTKEDGFTRVRDTQPRVITNNTETTPASTSKVIS